MAEPIPIRVAQTLGLSSSLVLAGASFSLSAYVVPSILSSPAPLLLRQWHTMFARGKAQIPTVALISALSYSYLAYSSSSSASSWSAKRTQYTIAGVLAVGLVPYTVLFMKGTNDKLFALIERISAVGGNEIVVEGGETVHSLVDWWAVLNLGRCVLLASAGVLGTWTALN
ncbi:hypothetical protein B0O99DRAFT_683694 [Bisporella sp. PMI_857]|nr:hypothetical protein B0O99DRAFT_683694 [Bisporella sp. PMI_857]